MLAPALVMLVVLAAATLGAIFYYGDRRKITITVLVVTFVGWYFPFSIVFLVPLDILSTSYNGCNTTCEEPIAYVGEDFLSYIWQINYWTSFVLTWVLAPFLQTYTLSGGFTFWQRCWDSIKENGILYAVLGVVAAGALIYIGVAYQMSTTALLDFVMLLANAYGLLLVVIFMSYGMIDIPRRLWYKGNHAFQLRYTQFRAPTFREDYEEAESSLRDIYREINWAQGKVAVSSKHRKWLDVIIAKCPPEYADAGAEPREDVTEVSDKQLRKLHASLMDTLHVRDRCRTQWVGLMKRAFLLEDIDTCRASGKRVLVHSWKPAGGGRLASLRPRLAWWYSCVLEPWLCRIAAGLAAVMSVLLLWSECTFSVEQPKLSVFYLLLNAAGARTFGVMLVSLTTLFYMCACAYSSLMRLRIFNYFYLVGGHHTDSNSLLFLGAMLCRLTFPLCYNFTFLVDISGTVFQSQMGDVEFMPLLGVGFNVYFPIIMSLLCLLVLFNVFERILVRFHVRVFRYSDVTDDVVRDGKELIERVRTQMARSPGDEAAFDIVAGTYRGPSRPRRGAPPPPGSSSTSPTLSPLEIEEPDARPATAVARVRSALAAVFGGRGRGERALSSSAAAKESLESRAPLRGPGGMNGARGAVDDHDADDVDERLAALDIDSLNMIAGTRAASSRYGGRPASGRAKRDFFADV